MNSLDEERNWRDKERGERYSHVFDWVLFVLHRAIPESLCWHVLEGVTNALLWLHYGLDNTHVEDDWNPIALINIHPGASMFFIPLTLPSPVCPLFSLSQRRRIEKREEIWRKHRFY